MKSSTINKQEIAKFSKIANEWWSPNGKFKPLHKFNPIRVQYLKENIMEHFKLKQTNSPLKSISKPDAKERKQISKKLFFFTIFKKK